MFSRILNKYKDASVEVKSSFAYTVCNIVQRGLSIITLPLFSRLLTKAQYGQATVFASTEAVLNIFLTLYLAYGSFDTAMIRFSEDRDRYLSAVNGLCTALCLGFMIIYIPLRDVLNPLLRFPTPMVIVMVIQVLLNNLLACWYGKERFEYHYKNVIGMTLGISFLAPVAAFILVMNTAEKGYARIIGYFLPTLAAGIYLYIRTTIKGKGLYHKDYWRYALRFNIPLIPYYLSQVVYNQSDKLMIERMVSMEAAADYGMAYTLALLTTIIINAVNNAYVPWIYRRIKSGDLKKNRTVAGMLLGMIAVMLLLVIALSPEVIIIGASAKYATAIWAVPPVAMSVIFIFYTQCFTSVEFYYENKSALVSSTAASALLNIVLNYLLIPRFGYVAAAYTTLISYIVLTLMHYLAYKRTIRDNHVPDELYNFRLMNGITAGFLISGFVLMALYNHMLVRYVLICIALVVIYMKRNGIMSFYRQLKAQDD